MNLLVYRDQNECIVIVGICFIGTKRNFDIKYLSNNKWMEVETNEQTTTIGYKRIVRFKTIDTKKIRVIFKKSRGCLCISTIEAYCI